MKNLYILQIVATWKGFLQIYFDVHLYSMECNFAKENFEDKNFMVNKVTIIATNSARLAMCISKITVYIYTVIRPNL